MSVLTYSGVAPAATARGRAAAACRASALASVVFAAACLVTAGAVAAPAAVPADCPREYVNEFQAYVENDKWSGTDRHYTNGLKFGFGTDAGTLADLINAPSESLLRRLTDGRGCVQLGLFFGQNLYTPRRITVATPQPDDRPWAAWLYVGGVAQRVEDGKLQTVEFDVGVVGPAALGREVQTQWHELIGVDRPAGWAHQIPNQPGVLVAYLEKRRYGTGVVQVVPHWGATVGNVMTLARAGAIVRTGRRMTGFGPDTIEPGGAMLQATRVQSGEPGRGSLEWYVFAGFDARAVAHNVFLDGPWFREGPSVDRRAFVIDRTVGFSARIARTRLSVTRVQRSEEFSTPAGGGGAQRFYSFNLGLQF